ncbi:MAG: hypothetical protein AAF195_02495 [Pseudomonadota bacterium]
MVDMGDKFITAKIKQFMHLSRCIMLLFLLSVMLIGCRIQSTPDNILAPWPFRMGGTPEGSKEFKLGWEHGCHTGLSTMVTSGYKTFYSFEQDPTMTQNADYYKAWKDAYTYCRQYSFKWTMWSWDQK